MEFKKGSYVVLLSSCNGNDCWQNDIPEGYCYKLSKDCTKSYFYIEKDVVGDKNGWDYDGVGGKIPRGDKNGKLKLREATIGEVMYYDMLNKPFNVKEFKKKQASLPRVKKENYNYLVKLLKNIK